MRKFLFVLPWIAVTLCGLAFAAAQVPLISSPDGDSATWKRIEFPNNRKVEEIWEKYHFTPEAFQEGERTVPRIYLSDIPARWGQTVAPSLTVRKKKVTFLYGLIPMVLAADEEVMLERKRLDQLSAKRKAGKPWTQAERDWLHALSARYGVEGKIDTPATLDVLMMRVDVVPASLVLAQAAVESGWGTSRFAAEGSALFGQWTYDGSGITPKGQQTASKGNHKIRAFAMPKDSIRAYLLNLNTHQIYAALRRYRRDLRKEGKPLTGDALASGLLNYSERGQAYVDDLRTLIHRNNLEEADFVTLRNMKPILLVPVGKGID
ncbi:Bax domain protein [delta proteobacterium NaphS2]|nr:Bax domain protein [delta proteobacterium NaphS2]